MRLTDIQARRLAVILAVLKRSETPAVAEASQVTASGANQKANSHG